MAGTSRRRCRLRLGIRGPDARIGAARRHGALGARSRRYGRNGRCLWPGPRCVGALSNPSRRRPRAHANRGPARHSRRSTLCGTERRHPRNRRRRRSDGQQKIEACGGEIRSRGRIDPADKPYRAQRRSSALERPRRSRLDEARWQKVRGFRSRRPEASCWVGR